MIEKLKALGPGLLYAGAAIGVSHIVQSTRAGAEYGYVLITAIVLAHIFKYPFFVIGPRYTNMTGETLITAYRKTGRGALLLVFLLTFLTMFSVQAAVTVVTAGLAQKLTGINVPVWMWSGILLLICFVILQVGKFKVLDNLMKVIMVVLAISTLLAASFSFGVEVELSKVDIRAFSFSSNEDIGFLVAFIGWMPAPLEIAIWHSIWTAGKYANKGRNSLKSENFDFNIGFYGTGILAICFLLLGANTLYGSGVLLESSAGKYAAQLVDIYTSSLGTWSYFIIVIAAFTTMFSTTLTCFDAMPRVIREIMVEWQGERENVLQKRWFWMTVLGLGALTILTFFISNMKEMVTIATVVSFVTAPFLAYLSYRVVKGNEAIRGLWNKHEYRLAIAGLLFLSTFTVYFISTIL